ncbi:tripartite-type tricarboxylate transporter receptor subunit TctC [Neobacillus niacini]|uniref:tripartite tricarboxylate transporter substrate binding protein n=1 Tax=Neobacillus niacini TaxID=86668 RepID=UPI002785C737|nr:tripartite tricarboxylate transporter substrate binding protein [Neobacillus niacini]MDQ1002034.1 tripartite-type tricarboxylate transporter receptor subunit TctC [Neobacillus niacini]
MIKLFGRKKWISIMVVGLMLIISGCSSKQSSSEKDSSEAFPNGPIKVIVSYSAGGSSDLGARLLMQYVEKELGVPVVVENRPGAGGWVGWEELLMAEPDGNTIALINTPNLMTGYMDPSTGRKQNLESFELIANHITDPGVIAVRKDDERFNSVEDLIEYAKKNTTTTTSTGALGDDHIASLKLNKELETKFNAVHNGGTGESVTAVLGGHVDVLFANIGDVTTLSKDNEVKVLAVMAEERSPILPDVPTLGEEGYEGIVSGSSRGYAAPKGVDKEKMKVLREAFEKAINNPEQIEKMKETGLQVNYLDQDPYMELLREDEKGIKGISDLLGW